MAHSPKVFGRADLQTAKTLLAKTELETAAMAAKRPLTVSSRARAQRRRPRSLRGHRRHQKQQKPARPDARPQFSAPPPMDNVRAENQSEHTPVRQMSTGDRTILGRISKRGNRYLRTLFMQGARVILLRPTNWAKHSFGPWLAAAAKRLHHNVLATALANKLARIASTVLARRPPCAPGKVCFLL